ncbi:hypothetical protein KDK82_4118 [Delftia sp. K82]|uniref:hypothetical protein n=1 Tax=Delftia sp. K82 TaxID=1472718 RepID=UPI000B72A60B|nr:hypothetical protein [Delftia sp. K82]OWG14871.1 hypothetical protein KDK82_4118 [Delftia sp. K82]
MSDAEFKRVPWIIDEERKFYYLNDSSKINDVICFRDIVDNHFGAMISADYVDLKGWSVGIISCNDGDLEGYFVDKLFNILENNFEEYAYALPSKSFSKKDRNKIPEIEMFSPALIANFYLNIENVKIIRRGMIPLYDGSYFIFPESKEFCYLNVCDEYHMIAGEKELVIESFGSDIKGLWKRAIDISGVGSSSEADIVRAARSYGYI